MDTEDVFGNLDDTHFEMRRKSSFSKLTGQVPRGMPSLYLRGDKSIVQSKEKLWKMMSKYIPSDMTTIQQSIVNHVEYTLARNKFNMNNDACYRASAYSVRDRLIESLNETNIYFASREPKRCYYLSLEFLMGRAMRNALINIDLEENYGQALQELGYDLEELYDMERDPALGNGGLGRLAACFLDSAATLNYPCWGYGIRYTYGIFEQKIINGKQVEHPDYWLNLGNPWEIARHDCSYAIRFYGKVSSYVKDGETRYSWNGGEIIQAMAYDNPVTGFDTLNTINLRLWKACPSKEFNFKLFSEGQYLEAVRERQRAEYVTAVLYPNDSSTVGKELRLKQQYFFVCATLQDILRRYKKRKTYKWTDFPESATIQLNDTHPTIAIPELMRLLIDFESLSFDEAWSVTRRVFNYTNHTVLPEALETWSVSLIEYLLPRHLMIIYEINHKFLSSVRELFPQDDEIAKNLSLIEESGEKKVRMANLAVIGSNKVNGVAAIHTDLVISKLFPNFVRYYEKLKNCDKFINITNGVTPRRWLHVANSSLSNLFSSYLGSDDWLKDHNLCEGLLQYIDDPDFLAKWVAIKNQNKMRLAEWVKANCQLEVDAKNMLFDIQVKRIHEYKRQNMNLFYIIHRYLALKRMTPAEREKCVPRAVFIGGKAAPGYWAAKTIIKMICSASDVINSDLDTNKYLKLCFIPNYNVSNAELVIPASDLSQHISTAGTEASGTSNMKFVMNGGLIIGTLDGANVEIREACGLDTMFIFGATVEQIENIRQNARAGKYPIGEKISRVFNWILSGNLCRGNSDLQHEYVGYIEQLKKYGDGNIGDFYLLIHDFDSYCECQNVVDAAYKDKHYWSRLCAKVAVKMGRFSSDRTINEYAEKVWNIRPCDRAEMQEVLPKVTHHMNGNSRCY